MPYQPRRVLRSALAAITVTAGVLCAGGCVMRADPVTRAGAAAATRAAHTDVLFVGAHPDDEYQSLATFGQWRERDGLSTGVVTITRGEGGGNAVGPEEGAELGMIREGEEREAVGLTGIRNVFYLDKPDFWYTLNAPLAGRVWNRPPQQPTDTLERLVRLIRATTPKTVVTMDPRPVNQHGAHQQAARLAIEAFHLAGEPQAFPEQLTEEKYSTWKPDRLLTQSWGFRGPTGEQCSTQEATDPKSGLPVIGVWSGARSAEHDTTWAQVERDAARTYVTQGFGSLPATVDTPPDQLPCEWFTVLADGGTTNTAPEHDQPELLPVYAEFRDWTWKVNMPWLANDAQPTHPESPITTIPEVDGAPSVDGTAGAGEYPGDTLRLTHWEGSECAPADCSAEAHLARHGDDLYVLVHVTDDTKGAALDAQADCKRHWRTDSIEIDLDPQGRSDDTSTTFKAAVFPFTAPDSGPCAERDGDNRQGPANTTAPGMTIASTVTEPYTGYTVEAKIPLADLPAAVDPERLTANILVYDSDTQDNTGRSRLAWSPYGSAQADPYVWGTAHLPAYIPSPGQPEMPAEIPLEATQSANSPASVAQSRRTGIPLAGGPRR
ncbi:sugar-binding protein [Embleya sp. NPDC055664]